MGFKTVANRTFRIFVLIALGLACLTYLIGLVSNVFGLMDLRPSDEKMISQLQEATGTVQTLHTLDQGAFRLAYFKMPALDTACDVAVFYIHGSPGSIDANNGFLLDAHLRAHATQYTYDRVGYGGSYPRQAEPGMSEQAAQLAALIRHAGVSTNILVGHSLGCTIAACLAIDEPGLVDGLVLVAAPLDPALEPSSWWRPILDLPVIRSGIPAAMHVSNHELAPLKKELGKYQLKWNQLRCPVTLIHGSLDELVPVENIDFVSHAFTNAASVKTVVLENDGHFIYWTKQELIGDEIVEIIDYVGSSHQQ